MTDLTKRESFYFIVSALAALSVLITILAFWSQGQPRCWDKYSTEEQAIAMCEQ
jgi:hypothetical protein